MNVSADLIPITSETGETSNFAAIRGARDFPKAVAPTKICVKLNCFCDATTNGVMFSAVKPLNASPSAIRTFDKPLLFETASTA